MSTHRQRARAAVTGLLAAACAVAVGHLVAGLVNSRSSPLIAVGNTAIDLTPQPVKEFAISAFGGADKLVLLLGMALVIGMLGAVGGMVARRRRWLGVVLMTVFAVIGGSAVLARPDFAGWPSLLAPAASWGAGVGSFGWLHARAFGESTSADSAGAREDRRGFLRAASAALLGAGAAGASGQMLGRNSAVQASRRAVAGRVAATRTPPVPPIPQGADFAGQGTPGFLTPNRSFYRVDTALSVPQVRAEDWRLRVHGMVDRELVLRFDDLFRYRLVQRPITLTCVSNEVGGPLVSTATFLGVPIRDVLRQAGVRPGAQQLFTTSTDGFNTGTPLDALLDPHRDALLAIGMNGQPLPAEHGFPVRMVVPGLYGYVSATKWLTDAEVTTFAREHYWEQRGWSKQAPIKTESRIDRPVPGSALPAGRVTLAGIAWAQHTGIESVEVRVDQGPWRSAELSTEVSADTWRMWRHEADLAAGEHTVQCRATDRSGRTQTEQRRPSVPNGATGRHTLSFTCS